MIGVILAGGQSSRMGIDKATLSIANTTLLEFMRGKLQSAGIGEIVICRNAPGYLSDDIPLLGPLGALYTLSQRYGGQSALIIPVDMPLLSEATLRRLLVAGESNPIDQNKIASSPAVLTPSALNQTIAFGDQIFPLLLPFSPTVVDALERRVRERSDLSIAALLRETGVQRLPEPETSEQFLNANTPGQWQAILARISPHAGPTF